MVQHGATWCNIVQYLLGGADRPLGLLNQHGSSHPAEDGEVPGPRQRHRGRRLQVLQHPLEIGTRGVINQRNKQVLNHLCMVMQIKRIKNVVSTCSKLALLGSYTLWNARYSTDWSSGGYLKP